MNAIEIVIISFAAFCGSAAGSVAVAVTMGNRIGKRIAKGYTSGIDSYIAKGEEEIQRKSF